MEVKPNFFGTDGVRGRVGEWPITVDFILKLGWAVGHVLKHNNDIKILVGKDTRISGYMIESALEAGFSAAGVSIYLLGPLPTSAIAYLTRTFRAHMGIVISASHNPYDDNGIKFFSTEGYKISKSVEQSIEATFQKAIITNTSQRLGKVWRIDDAPGRYIEFCKSTVPHNTNLRGLKIVVDCANGATYHIAPDVFRELGANVIPIYTNPDGLNINDNCGSMHPEVIQRKVKEEQADLGIAFDGDGDRVVMIDHLGEILDGDELLYIIAKDLLSYRSDIHGVVGTFMSNCGLELAFREMGLEFLRVPVGDHNVIEALIQKKWLLGGEPSGHIILLPVTTTADGIITALHVLEAMLKQGMNLHDMKSKLKKFPQRIMNIPHHSNHISLENAEIVKAIKNAEKQLGQYGRVVVRYSGTEPIIRVMVEGENNSLVDNLTHHISEVIVQVLKK